MSTGAIAHAGAPDEPRHGVRIAIIWAIAVAIAVPVMIWVLGPDIPPGNMSVQSSNQHDINVTLATLAMPVLMFIWVYFAYAIVVFRQPPAAAAAAHETELGRTPSGQEAALVDGPPILGHARIQLLWLVVTSVIVLGLAVFGTISLLSSSGAGQGGGQGPNPLVKPPAGQRVLVVQVIGQQWLWTFRYPSYGGVETPYLAIPNHQWVAFHVTSLDVDHSFWAYELGVKADAVPGNDNVAYVLAKHTGVFQIRCAELCGLWHGHMNGLGHVLTQAGFSAWIAKQVRDYAGVTKYLPPYSKVYFPAPSRRA